MNIFKAFGYTAIVLILTAVIIPGLAVPAVFFSVPCGAFWLLGECIPEEETTDKVTLKK